MRRIIVATVHDWNIKNAYKLRELMKEIVEVVIIDNKDKLRLNYVKDIDPEYIFFPHWSWKIDQDIYSYFRCVVFHMTDLPYGRGGTPLQNLIEKKVFNTKISAIQVQEELDSGKVYMKKDFYIGLGSAEEIYISASKIIFFDMIPYIVIKSPVPYEQEGEVVKFERRKPEHSNIFNKEFATLTDLYHFIRMLDAEEYPKAYIKFEKFKIEFSEVHIKNKKLVGRFEVLGHE